MSVWARVFPDLLISAAIERKREMSRKFSSANLAAIVLLVPTIAFLFIMFTRFVLGVEGLYNAWDRFYTDPGLSALNWVLERIMVLAPFAALALAALPATQVRWTKEEGGMVASVSMKLNPATAAVIVLSLAVIGVIMGYGFVENFRPV